MFPQFHQVSRVAQPQWSARTTQALDSSGDSQSSTARKVWLAAFTERLAELRPDDDEDALRALAAELWEDVGGHDPMIAAEMEHEASYGTDRAELSLESRREITSTGPSDSH